MPRSKTKLHKAVVVMFDPDATMRLYRWWLKNGYWDTHCRYRDSLESQNMCKKYPQLKRVSTEEFIEPWAVLRDCVASPILAEASKKGQKVFARVSEKGPHFALRAGVVPAFDQEGEALDGGFAYVLMGYDEMEVLHWFPEKIHSLVATWQIRLPSQKNPDPSDLRRALSLGFFPALRRPRWLKEFGPLRVSENISHDMGIFVNPSIIWAEGGGVEISPFSSFVTGPKNFILSTAQ